MAPLIYYETTKIRREELLREAEKERLIKIAQENQPKLNDKIQTKIGQLLVNTGRKLRNPIAIIY